MKLAWTKKNQCCYEPYTKSRRQTRYLHRCIIRLIVCIICISIGLLIFIRSHCPDDSVAPLTTTVPPRLVRNCKVGKFVRNVPQINVSTLLALEKTPNLMPDGSGLTVTEFIQQLDVVSQIPTPLLKDNKKKRQVNKRQTAVIDEFMHSWQSYKRYAWGHDYLKPKSKTYANWFGVGLSIVDSLDTLYLMGLRDEFNEAVNWVRTSLHFDRMFDESIFELNIRVLGGLLSAYHLSDEKILLQRAIELGNYLLPLFSDSHTGLPYQNRKHYNTCYLSEVGTLQLEFRELSLVTGVAIYEKVIELVNDRLHNLPKFHGLTPVLINRMNSQLADIGNSISLGAYGDSYYEYLLKQWLQTGRHPNDDYVNDYKKAINGVLSQLVRHTQCGNFTYIGQLMSNGDWDPRMDHLLCFLPGTLMLGYHFGMPESHMKLAHDLLATCLGMYQKQTTGLAPEQVTFNTASKRNCWNDFAATQKSNKLRPEFIESLYYFYVFTGHTKYQDIGWNIFKTFKRYSRIESGYTPIGNTMNMFKTPVDDVMDSYWLAETLKYFYLLFSDDRQLLDLYENWILNTEAHPLPMR